MELSQKGVAFRNMQEENSNMCNKTVQEIVPLQPYHQTFVDRIIVNGDYSVEGTDNGTWNKIWYVNTKISKHMTPNRDLMVIFKGRFLSIMKMKFATQFPYMVSERSN